MDEGPHNLCPMCDWPETVSCSWFIWYLIHFYFFIVIATRSLFNLLLFLFAPQICAANFSIALLRFCPILFLSSLELLPFLLLDFYLYCFCRAVYHTWGLITISSFFSFFNVLWVSVVYSRQLLTAIFLRLIFARHCQDSLSNSLCMQKPLLRLLSKHLWSLHCS